MFLSALATVNFSLSFLVGILASPVTFVRRSNNKALSSIQYLILAALNPMVVMRAAAWYFNQDIAAVLVEAAEGWHVWGLWTQVVVWLIWWPVWFAGSVIVGRGMYS